MPSRKIHSIMKIKIYKIIETSVVDYDVEVTVRVFLRRSKAEKEFKKRMAAIEADAEGVFDEFGDDDCPGAGVREASDGYFGIHRAGEASLWDCSVKMEEDYLR